MAKGGLGFSFEYNDFNEEHKTERIDIINEDRENMSDQYLITISYEGKI